MSHATVLVVTKEKPTQQDLEKAMQPYHEYECTGINDEYVVWVDETEEKRKEFENGTRDLLVDKEGNMYSPYSDEFYRDPTEEEKEKIGFGGTGFTGDISYTSKDWGDGLGYRAKVKFSPEHLVEKEVPFSQYYSDLKHFLTDWEGYDDSNFKEDGSVGRYTNPNSKWDWWQIGGRWAGFFIPKSFDNCEQGKKSWTNKNKKISGVDIIQKKNINIEKMEKEAIEQAEKDWAVLEKYFPDISKFPQLTWRDCVDIYNSENETFNRDEVSKILKSQEYYSENIELLEKEMNIWGCGISFFCRGNKEEFIKSQIYAKFGTYAILKDNFWYERGTLGWFGSSSNENENWESTWLEIFDSIPEDSWLTIIDYHV